MRITKPAWIPDWSAGTWIVVILLVAALVTVVLSWFGFVGLRTTSPIEELTSLYERRIENRAEYYYAKPQPPLAEYLRVAQAMRSSSRKLATTRNILSEVGEELWEAGLYPEAEKIQKMRDEVDAQAALFYEVAQRLVNKHGGLGEQSTQP